MTFWKNRIISLIMSLFDFSDFEAQDIDKYFLFRGLIENGNFGITKQDGVIIGCTGKLIGMPNIYWIPSDYIFVNIKGSEVNVREDTPIFFADKSRKPLSIFVDRFATFFDDLDLSLDIAIKNTRLTKALSVGNSVAQTAVKEAVGDAYAGKPCVLVDDDLFKDVTSIDLLYDSRTNNLLDLLETKERLWSDFLNAIGISVVNEKKERLIEREIKINDLIAEVSIESIMDCFQDGVKKMHDVFPETGDWNIRFSKTYEKYRKQKESKKESESGANVAKGDSAGENNDTVADE